MRLILVIIACAVLISACASKWTLVGNENETVRLSQVTFKIPLHWVLYNNHFNEYTAVVNGKPVDNKVKRVIVSRDGLNLNIIDIIEFKREKAFPSINKAVHDSTLPSEMAELFIAEQEATLGIDNLQILTNEPATVAGQKGFTVHFRYKTQTGLQKEQVVYGFSTPNKFYIFKFFAPSLHYFETNSPEFEALIKSIKLNS